MDAVVGGYYVVEIIIKIDREFELWDKNLSDIAFNTICHRKRSAKIFFCEMAIGI